MVEIGKIDLSKLSVIKDFVSTAMLMSEDIQLSSDKYVVNGKSIMGIFSLDLSEPITLSIDTKDEVALNNAKEEFKDFIIK